MRWLAGTALFLMCSAPLAAAQYLSQEPRMGALKEGERVLVDDGSCGPGKVKEVIGGNHVKVGGTKRIERTRRCIAK
jgi:Family of unknown function (DUF6719)